MGTAWNIMGRRRKWGDGNLSHTRNPPSLHEPSAGPCGQGPQLSERLPWGEGPGCAVGGAGGTEAGREGNWGFPLSGRRKCDSGSALFPEGVSFPSLEWYKPRPSDFSDRMVWKGGLRAELDVHPGPRGWAVLFFCPRCNKII